MSLSPFLILEKLEIYIRKYFLNRLLKGLLLSFFLLVAGYLTVILIEYLVWLPSYWRMFFFWTYLLFLFFTLISFVFIPLTHLVSFRRKMSHEVAAEYIGKYFPEIDDSLLNFLQLQQLEVSSKETDFILAAIEQRTQKLSVYNFSLAAGIQHTLKLLPYGLGLLVLFLVISVFVPEVMQLPANRIIHYNTTFPKPLPYQIVVNESKLYCLQHEDYLLNVVVKGNQVPEKIFLKMKNSRFELQKSGPLNFSYTFNKVYEDIVFQIVTSDYQSQVYRLIVHPKPVLLTVELRLEFPAYLHRKGETLRGLNYLSVPAGTKMNYTLYTRDCDSVSVQMNSMVTSRASERDQWEFKDIATSSKLVVFAAHNKFQKKGASFEFLVDVVDDEVPVIEASVEQENLGNTFFFSGLISDDHGFSDLSLYYTEAHGTNGTVRIPIAKNLLRQNFYLSLNMDTMPVKQNDQWKVYFEVTDNDGIRGPKAKRTRDFNLNRIGQNELDSLKTVGEEKLDDQYNSFREQNLALKKEFEALKKSLLQKKELDWKDQQALKNLKDQQNTLMNQWEELKNERHKLDEIARNDQRLKEEMLQKQEQIREMFDELIPEELKKMMEEINQLLQQTNKEEIQNALEKLKDNSENMSDLLDRDLALLNRLKVEKNLNELIDKLKKLAEEAAKEADSLKNNPKTENNNSLNDIQKKFDQIKRELNKTDSLNKALEEPMKIERDAELEREIQQELQKGAQQQDQGNREEASEHAKESGEKMKEMADQLETGMAEGMEEQNAEDAEQLRKLLENILRASKQEEEFIDRTLRMDRDDPAYKNLIQTQSRMKESFRVIEDSLLALAKRQVAIQQFVFEEVKQVKSHFQNNEIALKERISSQASVSSQNAVMHLNNLALMLSESLQEMEDEMNKESSMQGMGMPKKGKGKGRSAKNMRELQEALGKQMKQKGEKSSGKEGSSSMSNEEFARMAAQQEMIRQQLQDYLNELKKEGSTGNQGLQKAIEEMEKMEKDLVNKRLTGEMVERQNEIVSRLLESERAEREREKEERRKSEEFLGKEKGNFSEEIPYKMKRPENENILLRQPLEFVPFYRSRTGNYLQKLHK